MIKFSVPVLATVLLASAASLAAPLPSGSAPVTITARDEPIAAFLRNLFNQAGRSVITSPALTGTVNGSFTGPADKVFRDISRAFNLAGYYDGSAVYIYPSSELTSKSFDVGSGGSTRVVRGIAALGVTDSQNFVRPIGTGTVVATGTPRFVDQVADLARASGPTATGALPAYNLAPLEPRTVPLEFRVFYLRYARAEDTTVYAGNREVRVPGIATIMRALVVDDRGRGAATSYGSRQVRSSAQRVGGTGLAAIAPDDTQSSVLGLPPVGGAQPGGVYGGDEGGAGAVPASTADIVRIEANPYMNAIIIRDAPQRMAAYESLIRAIDVEPQLVEIEATIIDINTTRARELGIDFRFGSGGFGALFGRGDASDQQLVPNPALSRRDNAQAIAPTARGLAISTVIGAQREFLARISALETKGAARVVSRPQVMTLSNVEAVFDRTRTFYVRVAGRQNVDLFNVTSGTTLRVNPSVFRDQGQTRIRVLISIEDGSISAQSVDQIPVVDRASVNTQALILEGESLLLGGLTSDIDANAEDKIPLLGDIPVLGNLFKKQRRQRDRVERLFLITPRLASLTPRLPVSATPAALAAPLPQPPRP